MKWRGVRRAVSLALALAVCIFKYWIMRVRGPLTLEGRALWLHSACSGVLGALGIATEVRGAPPVGGLVVANHLSYLDIIILSAAMPCFFVAKMEINRWPYFGKAARTGGTIFIDRSSRLSAAAAAGQIAERLALRVPVLLFPEGTSSDGARVLPFHSSLFEPAAAAAAPVTAAAVRYALHDGAEERDLCWFDDTLFLPHIWKTLCTGGFSAQVMFGEPQNYPSRRAAAQATHAVVTAMRNAMGGVCEAATENPAPMAI